MVGRDPDVLVEVERRDLRPVDVGRLAQRGEELVLRRRGREDHAGRPVAGDERADRVRDDRRRGRSHRRPVRVDLHAQAAGGEDAGARRRRVASRAQLTRRPADEVGQCHLRLVDLRVPALLPLERHPAVVARTREPREDASPREVARAGEDGRPRHPPVARPSHVLQMDVAHERAECSGRRLRLLAELGERVRRVPHEAEAARRPPARGASARRWRSRSRRGSRARPRRRCRARGRAARASDSAIQPRVEARSAPGCTRSPKTRMPGAPSAAARSAERTASSIAVRRVLACGVMEEGARVDARDREARVGEAAPRLDEAGARQLRPRPERVVALEEAQLDAVVAEPARGVEDAGEAPGGTAEGREGEAHQVIRSSMSVVTRVGTGRPAKKRATVSRTMSAMLAAHLDHRRPDVRREDRPAHASQRVARPAAARAGRSRRARTAAGRCAPRARARRGRRARRARRSRRWRRRAAVRARRGRGRRGSRR